MGSLTKYLGSGSYISVFTSQTLSTTISKNNVDCSRNGVKIFDFVKMISIEWNGINRALKPIWLMKWDFVECKFSQKQDVG